MEGVWDDEDEDFPDLRRRSWVLVAVATVAALVMLGLLVWAVVDVVGDLGEQQDQLEAPT